MGFCGFGAMIEADESESGHPSENKIFSMLAVQSMITSREVL
jgi:hypothetical protein